MSTWLIIGLVYWAVSSLLMLVAHFVCPEERDLRDEVYNAVSNKVLARAIMAISEVGPIVFAPLVLPWALAVVGWEAWYSNEESGNDEETLDSDEDVVDHSRRLHTGELLVESLMREDESLVVDSQQMP